LAFITKDKCPVCKNEDEIKTHKQRENVQILKCNKCGFRWAVEIKIGEN
jgi:uncharacterized metal-binding protein (TIGR02443 family)